MGTLGNVSPVLSSANSEQATPDLALKQLTVAVQRGHFTACQREDRRRASCPGSQCVL
jgi:hypothetical protein